MVTSQSYRRLLDCFVFVIHLVVFHHSCETQGLYNTSSSSHLAMLGEVENSNAMFEEQVQ